METKIKGASGSYDQVARQCRNKVIYADTNSIFVSQEIGNRAL